MTTRLLLLPLLTAGCMLEGGDDLATSTDTEDLVGAYATTARPEIGEVFINGGCTGTLIAPRVVLTASHCLLPVYVGAAVAPAGSTFQFTDAGGTVRSYGIDKIFSFHPQGDVAIVHLTAAVPSVQAVPATIAAAPPELWATSTTYGYGCNSDSFTGGGIKRAFTFAYGQSINRLCPGDSGGPVTFGYSTGTGAIWGINVMRDPDVFGMVTYLLPEIEAVKRRWDGNWDLSVDRPGMDFSHTSAANAEGCNQLCDNTVRCKAWSFVPSTNACFLKDGVPDPVAAEGVTSGLVRPQEVGYDRPGYDRTLVNYGTGGNPSICQAECSRYGWCKAWTYVSTTHQCWLKDATPPRVASASCTSGTPERTYEVGYDRPGGDLGQVHADDAGDCAWSCSSNTGCKAFVWSATRTVPGTANNCWLKTTVTPSIASPAFTSGVRRGMQPGMATSGTEYSTVYINSQLWPLINSASPTSASAFACQAACANDLWCKAWNARLADGYGLTCGLISSPGALVVAYRSITGYKGTDFEP